MALYEIESGALQVYSTRALGKSKEDNVLMKERNWGSCYVSFFDSYQRSQEHWERFYPRSQNTKTKVPLTLPQSSVKSIELQRNGFPLPAIQGINTSIRV
jgi:hypothetical protein